MKNRDKEKGNMKERVRDMAVTKIRSKKFFILVNGDIKKNGV